MNISITDAPAASMIISIQINDMTTAAGNIAALATPEQVTDIEALPAINAEDSIDYSSCEGYDENFLGFLAPLPSLSKKLKRKVATYPDNKDQYILKYYHYSTIHHAVRRMPVVSAVNVDGNPAERKDKAKRVDVWLRDHRIDYDVQLNNEFYKRSGFDRGHMSRREDAKWDDTPEEAERDAQLTCMYTNAVPQVAAVNRPPGLWGNLEKIILEKGVAKEDGAESKICVYNGPVFGDDDPVYKGIQVPLLFYKIVVWLNATGAPKTTAFILSQKDLTGAMEIEELHYDKEFIEHQCSVAYIENLTSLSFTGIKQYDTYQKAADDSSEVQTLNREDLNNLLLKQDK